MYCAYIKIANKWIPTHNQEEVINHDGPVIVFDTKVDKDDIKAEIQSHEPDKYVSKCDFTWEFMATDFPYFDHLSREAEESLTKHTKIYVGSFIHGFIKYQYKNKTVYVAGKTVRSIPNVVLERDDDIGIWIVTLNPEIWERANKRVTRAKQKSAKEKTDSLVKHTDIQRCLWKLQTDGFNLSKPTLGQIVVAIMACDFYKGVAYVDDVLKKVAHKWLKHADANKARFIEKRWATEKQLEFLNSRFKKVAENEQPTNE